MKKLVPILLVSLLPLVLCACGENAASFDKNERISVIQRAEGSGTREAFSERIGIPSEEKKSRNAAVTDAVIADHTEHVIRMVENDPYAIGYVSLGALKDTVKAIAIDGVKASPETIKNGTYKLTRPFLVVTKEEPNELTKDFIAFILSKEGQEVLGGEYIALNEDAPAFAGKRPPGTLTVTGSSSVGAVMEKLKEAYARYNPAAELRVHESDSAAGIDGVRRGLYDIGMASREITEQEKKGLSAVTFARDGAVVIINQKNVLKEMSSEQVKRVFTGESTRWSELIP